MAGDAGLHIRAAALEVRHLSKAFGATRVVSDVSFRVAGGSLLTLLGPSGSGKTTSLRMIAGFEEPTEGQILVADVDITERPAHKRNIGVVFQQYALFPHLTVFQNIAYPLEMRRSGKAEIRSRVEAALDLVRLQGYEARYPHQLSGGQQQRVALARAIVFQPRLLLMDEPLGALDKQLRENLQLEMRRLHADLGITFIYVTHDQEEALTMSDRIAVMNDGKVAQVGRPEDLYDRPTSRFVAGFIGESNFLPAIVRGLEDDVVVAECDGAIIRAVCPTRPAAGEKVMLTTRPERLRFADNAWNSTMAQNRLSVTVTEAVFAGERRRYMLQAGDGTAMVLKEPSSAAIRRRTVGEQAEIAWSVAPANRGPNGLSIMLITTRSPWLRLRPGASPKARAKASRKPL
jgi:spermidine/putrescine ABC transporter ATP-binding subunit